MAEPEKKKKWETAAEAVFYLLVFAAITCFAMVQTYGDPPDEINRFKVVNYICNHGRLPHGADPEVLLDGYGASYAFQPILTYIIQGFLLRFLKQFTSDGYVLLLAARMVNAVFGVLMAYFVRCTAKEAWKNPYLQWTFTLMVVFLPQNIFIHSYVNTDSMAMLSVAMMFYVLLRAQRTGYGKKECILLAAGIILCAMSYYNAYGMIAAAILIFVMNYVHGKENGIESGIENGEENGIENGIDNRKENGKENGIRKENGNENTRENGNENTRENGKELARENGKKGRLQVEWGPMLQRGTLISVIVLAGISWWFIRNGILYGGDIIAMNARRECAIETAAADFNPLTRFTYRDAGIPLGDMLFKTGYLTLLRDSFIAMFGPMLIPTHGLIYLYYKRFWIIACMAAVLPLQRLWGWKRERGEERKNKLFFYSGMVLFCVITIGLSIYYSYTWEYQPQGRYILPVLIPLMYLVTLGVEKICGLLNWAGGRLEVRLTEEKRRTQAAKAAGICAKVFCLGIMAYVMLAFAYSLFDRFLPHYMQGENMFSMYGKIFP